MGEEIQNFRFVERERGKKQQFSIYSELSQRRKKETARMLEQIHIRKHFIYFFKHKKCHSFVWTKPCITMDVYACLQCFWHARLVNWNELFRIKLNVDFFYLKNKVLIRSFCACWTEPCISRYGYVYFIRTKNFYFYFIRYLKCRFWK